MTTPDGPALDVRAVALRLGGRAVLDGVSLAVAPGSVLGVIGPNGGGKTSLLRLALGQLKPDAGTVRVFGLAPRAAIARGDLVGYVPQESRPPAGVPLNVRQLVMSGLAGKSGLFAPPARDDVTFAEHIVERVGLAPHARVPILELSGGQYRRAMLARALAPRPRLLLLDEPTTGLDVAAQQALIALVGELRSELGLSAVFVSHDFRATLSLADRVACLGGGGLHFHDQPKHLSADAVYRTFGCEASALGLGGLCRDPACAGEHATAPTVSLGELAAAR